MNILTRQDAIKARQTTYYTGVPCKNGHLAKRYTRTSVCAECLHPVFKSTDSENRKSLRISRSKLITKKFRVPCNGLENFKQIILAFSKLREPDFEITDILSSQKSVLGRSDYEIHAFKIFPEDEFSLRLLEFPITVIDANPKAIKLPR